MADSKLPALPEPDFPGDRLIEHPLYSADQLRAYGQSCYEAGRLAGLEEAAKVCDRVAKFRSSPLVESIADAIRSLKDPQ